MARVAFLLPAALTAACGDDAARSEGAGGSGGTAAEIPGGEVLSTTVLHGSHDLRVTGAADGGAILAADFYQGTVDGVALAPVRGVFLAELDEAMALERILQWERLDEIGGMRFTGLATSPAGEVMFGCHQTGVGSDHFEPIPPQVPGAVELPLPCFGRVSSTGVMVPAQGITPPLSWNNHVVGVSSFVVDGSGGAVALIIGPDPDADDEHEMQDIVLAHYDAAGTLLASTFYTNGKNELNVGDLVAAPDGMRFWGRYTGSPDFGTGALPAPVPGTEASFIARTDGFTHIVQTTPVEGRIEALTRTDDGSLFLLTSFGADALNKDWVIEKRDATHSVLWQHPIELPSLPALAPDGSGGAHFAAGGGSGFSIGRISAQGEVVWRRDFTGDIGGPGPLARDAQGNLLVAVGVGDQADFGNGVVTAELEGTAVVVRVTP